MYKIMIVEDDETIAALLHQNLQKWGFETIPVHEFQTILNTLIDCQPHLVLLDISLPFFNGYYWCSEIRKISKIPIIFLSSRTENMDIVMAMNMGGDDYITKPFSLEILIAKIQAILRRTYDFTGDIQILEAKGAMLNISTTDLIYQGEKIELTKNEFKMLQLLLEQKNHVVSRDQIMKRLWDSDSFIDDNTLTVNINRLRKKLEESGLPDLILTKKGLGYMIYD